METERRTGGVAVPGDHPRDLLPEYVRGVADDPEAVRLHLAGCAECRREVGLLRALAGPGPRLRPGERDRAWARLRAETPGPAGEETPGPAGAGSCWLSVAWKVAAGIALLVSGLGVWQAQRLATGGGEWNPAAAMRGWEEDLAALRPAPEDVRLALGWEADVPGAFWDDLEEADPSSLQAPWEEARP